MVTDNKLFQLISFSVNKKQDFVELLINNTQLLADFSEDKKRHAKEVKAVRLAIFKYYSDPENFQENDLEALLELESKLLPSQDFVDEKDVTVDTLRATGGDAGDNHVWSKAGRYMVGLWVFLFIMIAFAAWFDFTLRCVEAANGVEVESSCDMSAVVLHLIEYLNPFLFGAIGACTYLLRISGERLHNRTFNPARFPEHINRLVLGAISGGIIIILLKEPLFTTVPKNELTFVPLGVATLGFVAGYSVELLYKVLDRIISSVLPASSSKFIKSNLAAKKVDHLIEKNTKLLAELQSADNLDKVRIEAVEGMLRDLGS